MHGTVFTGEDVARIYEVVGPKLRSGALVRNKNIQYLYEIGTAGF